jgi:hypothetical protein
MGTGGQTGPIALLLEPIATPPAAMLWHACGRLAKAWPTDVNRAWE